jgi:hypothetical protein
MRVTIPAVAFSISGQRSKGIGLTPLRHWLTRDGEILSFFAKLAFDSIVVRYSLRFINQTLANANLYVNS